MAPIIQQESTLPTSLFVPLSLPAPASAILTVNWKRRHPEPKEKVLQRVFKVCPIIIQTRAKLIVLLKAAWY